MVKGESTALSYVRPDCATCREQRPRERFIDGSLDCPKCGATPDLPWVRVTDQNPPIGQVVSKLITPDGHREWDWLLMGFTDRGTIRPVEWTGHEFMCPFSAETVPGVVAYLVLDAGEANRALSA